MKKEQKEKIKHFEELMQKMTDEQLNNLLLIGEGMVIMLRISKETKQTT